MSDWPAVLSSPELRAKVNDALVLMVGSGGIGCELLKTLVLSGFRKIEVVLEHHSGTNCEIPANANGFGLGVLLCLLRQSLSLAAAALKIDMDTIEMSNLNRQFLFRRRHIGEGKAQVAAAAVRGFCATANIIAHQANVKDARFGVEYIRRFTLVLNGLDNLEARRHVNRLCLAAGVPLVESGTAGYLGQAWSLRKGRKDSWATVHLRIRNPSSGEVIAATECFECQPKAVPKSFPVCTIRDTPEKPIHCIVWAKDLLFERLFGRPDVVTDLDEAAPSGVGPQQPAGPADGSAAMAPGTDAAPGAADPSAFLRREDEASSDYAQRVFARVFDQDIKRARAKEALWKMRKPPTPLALDAFPPAAAMERAPPANGAMPCPPSACRGLGLMDAHRVWTLAENAAVFMEAVRLFLEERPDDVGTLSFDKDDALAVEFVTAAANLRSLAYGIPAQSLFVTKGMAGNIIHAITTTNAIVSGLIAVEALKILAGHYAQCRDTYLLQHVSGKRALAPTRPSAPSAGCAVCGGARLELAIDTRAATLARFVDAVLKKRLAMNEPTIMAGGFLYEEGAGLEAEEVEAYARLLPLPLASLPGGGLGAGTLVAVSDQAQAFSAQILILHREDWDDEAEPDGFTIEGIVPGSAAADIATTNGAAGSSGSGKPASAVEQPAPSDMGGPRGKRKREMENGADAPAAKRGKDAVIAGPAAAGLASGSTAQPAGAEEGLLDDDDDVVVLD